MSDEMMSNSDKYIALHKQMKMSLDKAKTSAARERISKNFELSTQNFNGRDVSEALQQIDAEEEQGNPEDSKNMSMGGKMSYNKGGRMEYSKGGKMSYNKGGKMKYAEGSMLMPPEMGMEEDMPVDTYDNIPENEMAAAEASQLPDDAMEDSYLEFVLTESLEAEDQEYLMSVLETDERLSSIFDKVMDVAGEFSGEGEVDGPGTGVSDSIPARLSDGEFVFTKKATDQMGADQLQTMMDEAEKAFDGGYLMKKAFGGLTSEDDMDSYDSEEEVKKQMISANQMPSIR